MKKWFILLVIFLIVLISLGCSRLREGVKSMDLNSEYCGFKVGKITTESITTTGFQGGLDFAEQDWSDLESKTGGNLYAAKDISIYAWETDSCDLWYKFKYKDITYRIRLIEPKNRQPSPERDFRQDCIVTNEFGNNSCEYFSAPSSYNVVFIKKNFVAIVWAFSPWGTKLGERSDAEVIKNNVKIITKLVESNIY